MRACSSSAASRPAGSESRGSHGLSGPPAVPGEMARMQRLQQSLRSCRLTPGCTRVRMAGPWTLAWRGGRGTPWIHPIFLFGVHLEKIFSFKPKSSGFQKNCFFFFFKWKNSARRQFSTLGVKCSSFAGCRGQSSTFPASKGNPPASLLSRDSITHMKLTRPKRSPEEFDTKLGPCQEIPN